jgi:hypothetical protein
MILNMLFRSSFPVLLQSPINAGAFAMLFGLVLVPLVSSFTKSPDSGFIADTSPATRKKSLWRRKKALSE